MKFSMLIVIVLSLTCVIAVSRDSIVLSTTSIANFRISHPNYGTSLQSELGIMNYIIDQWNLSSTSTQEEVVVAVCLFNKFGDLQGNHSIIEGNTWHPKAPLNAYWSLYSTQCGDQRLRAMYLITLLCEELNLSEIQMEEVSWDGHQTFRYYSTTFKKWINADPDPGTPIYFISDGRGGWASPTELFNNSRLICSKKTPVDIERTEELAFGSTQLKRRYQHHMEGIISKMDSSDLLYYEAQYQKDTMNVFFRFPKGVKIRFIDKDRTKRGDRSLIGGEYIEVHINRGVKLDSNNWNMPLIPRSVEPENRELVYSINGHKMKGNSFNKIYLPTLSDANDLYVTDSAMNYIQSFQSPIELGDMKMTFYFNYKMIDFKTFEENLIIEKGDLDIKKSIVFRP